MPSFVWFHFTKLENFRASCEVKGCKRILCHRTGTKSLIYHLKHSHNIVNQTSTALSSGDETVENSLQATISQVPAQAPKRQRTLDDYCTNKSTLNMEIAQMVAKSNFSFNQIAQSKFIRESLAAKYPGQIIPTDNHTVAAMMMKFHDFAVEKTKQRIQELKDDGKKFSATLDEWTSSGNVRYINTNLHFTVSSDMKTSHINLGLVKIEGRCPAEKQVDLVRNLNLFELADFTF